MTNYNFDGNKLLWHMDRVHDHYRDGKRIAPLHIDIGATKMCNAKCVYCYGIHQKMSGEMIPEKALIRLFEDAPVLGIRSITLTGDGEPTLNPAVYDAVTVGKSRGLDIGFATNGIALTHAKIKVLLNSCTWLRFNLSAVSPAGYKSMHGVQQWETVQDNIKEALLVKQFMKSECTIGLQMVLIPECLSEVVDEAEWAVKHEVDYFVIKQYSDPGCPGMSQFDLNWYDRPLVQATLDKAESLSNSKTQVIAKRKTIASKGVRRYDRCVDCPLLFQISGNGKCYPCGYLFGNSEYCYGDIKEQSLGEILSSDRYWGIIRRMANEFDVHKDCTGCCRHDSTNEFIWGYLNKPDHINFI